MREGAIKIKLLFKKPHGTNHIFPWWSWHENSSTVSNKSIIFLFHGYGRGMKIETMNGFHNSTFRVCVCVLWAIGGRWGEVSWCEDLEWRGESLWRGDPKWRWESSWGGDSIGGGKWCGSTWGEKREFIGGSKACDDGWRMSHIRRDIWVV